MLVKFFPPIILLNLILIFSFSVSINYFVMLPNINLIFYIFFHITFIYILFFHYHYLLFVLGLIYGVLFDLLLLNTIGNHLICFLFLISIYIILKKFLFLLTPLQISTTIFIILIITLYSEVLIAIFFNNIHFSINQIIKYFIFSIIIFIPSIFLLNKLDT